MPVSGRASDSPSTALVYVPSEKSRSEIYLDFLPLPEPRAAPICSTFQGLRLSWRTLSVAPLVAAGNLLTTRRMHTMTSRTALPERWCWPTATHSSANVGFLVVGGKPGQPAATVTGPPTNWKDLRFFQAGKRHL